MDNVGSTCRILRCATNECFVLGEGNINKQNGTEGARDFGRWGGVDVGFRNEM